MRLLGSTNDIYNTLDPWGNERLYYNNPTNKDLPVLVKKCEWTPDGTSIIASCSDYALRLFIVPPSLLDETITQLYPYTRNFMPAPVLSYTVHPDFNLDNVESGIVAVSHRQAPVKLYNVLIQETQKSLQSLSIGKKDNEEMLPAYSMKFSYDRSSLICGSKNIISQFDMTTSNVKNTANCHGIASSLTTTHDLLIASGTFNGQVALFNGDLGNPIMAKNINEPVLDIKTSLNKVYVVLKSSIKVLDIKTSLSEIESYNKKFSHQRSYIDCDKYSLYHTNGSCTFCINNTPTFQTPGPISSVSIHPRYPIYATSVGDNNANLSCINIYK